MNEEKKNVFVYLRSSKEIGKENIKVLLDLNNIKCDLCVENDEQIYIIDHYVRIACYDFGRISKLGKKRYVIETKKHWWNKWKIRDWDDEMLFIPRFYESIKEAKEHL